MRNPFCTVAALALLLISAPAHGKTAEGVLDGVVLSSKGVPVAFAEILWQTADGKAPHAVRANGKGQFRIVGVRQGLYEVRAEGLGLTSDWEHNVLVRSGRAANLTLRLTHPIPRGSRK